MASEVGIVNAALIKIGSKQSVVSFDDGTVGANYAADRYEELRDDLLRSHNWNFAVRRQKLARTAETPAFGYRYVYSMPDKWLKLINAFDNGAAVGYLDFRFEGNEVHANAEHVYAKYVVQVTDPNALTADFRECLALSMAVELAVKVANSTTLSEVMQNRFERRLRAAKFNDAVDDRPRKLPRGSWAVNRGGR